MKDFFSKLWDGFKSFMKSAVVLTIVPVTVAVLDSLGCLSGGMLGPAVLTAIVFCVSVFFILMNLSPSLRAGSLKVIGKYGGWIDLVATVVLTYMGFHASVTMGLTMLMLGLNLSAMFSIIRLSQILTDPYVRRTFADEMNGGESASRKPKPRHRDCATSQNEAPGNDGVHLSFA